MARPLAALYDEHRSIAAVLATMEALVRRAREPDVQIDPQVFRAMLYYLDVFPERVHHPKEETVLFPYVRRRTRDGDAILAELGREHESGERAIRDLEQAFVRYEEDGRRELEPFAAAVERFAGRYRAHMDKEERQIMPLAERVLTAQDWAEIEAAFASHRDPLAGVSPEADHEALFRRILSIVPAPLGLGPAIRRR
jgi:hemerythrin-like domain-containing protein